MLLQSVCKYDLQVAVAGAGWCLDLAFSPAGDGWVPCFTYA